MIIMGIDLGSVRTGISLCDKCNILAYPFCLIKSSNLDFIAKEVASISKKNKVERIVIGNPKNMNGSTGEKSRNSQEFRRILSGYLNIKILLWDERLTTVHAQKNFTSLNIKSKKYKKNIDEAAATILLQSYIDFYKSTSLD